MKYQRGTIIAISELEQVRRAKLADIFKRYISVKITDTKQLVHLEIRNSGLKLIDHLDLKEGSEILFQYEFQGVLVTKSSGEKLPINNIVLTQIKNYIPHENKNQRNRGKSIRFSR